MSYLAQRAVLDTRTRVRLWTGGLTGLLTSAALLALAALLGLRWVQQTAAVPLTWQLPPAEALFLLPAVPVLGLVGLRLAVGGRFRTIAGHHLLTWASRWAWVWVAATAAGLVHTVQGLYGVPFYQLLGVDNLVSVAAASDAARTGLSMLWVALLVATFATRLGGWRESFALLVLTGTALVTGLPVDPALAHGHAEIGHPLLVVVATVQVLALATWLGVVSAVAHLRTPPYLLRHHLTRYGFLVTAAALLAGVAAVLGGMLLPAASPSLLVVLAQLAGIALVAVIGQRHRARILDVVSGGRTVLLVALVAGELVILVALIALGALLPTAF